jgi:type I restriction enzyme S subunit
MRAATQATRPILEELQAELQQMYGERFHRLILYGSHAREESTEDSDIDVVAVIEGIDNPIVELGKLSGLISRISLKYDTLISLYPIAREDFEKRNSPLLMNVKKEGISL